MFTDFYSSRIKGAHVTGKLIMGKCPFHDEQNGESFSAYIDSGTWACFGSCAIKGKGPEEFLARLHSITLEDAFKILDAEGLLKKGKAKKKDEPVVEEEKEVADAEVQFKHEALLSNQAVLDALLNRRGWTLETIKEFKLGWDFSDDRIWIPVMGTKGQWRNVRRYDWNHKAKAKFLHYEAGYGANALWPCPTVPNEIILCEGEPDALLLRSWSLPSFSFTSGADGVGKLAAARVTILFDSDKAGAKGALKAAAQLKAACGEVRIMTLPTWEGMPGNADVTDWWKAGGTKDLFLENLRLLWLPPEVKSVSLPEAIMASNFDKTVKVSAVASGKNLSPYQVPNHGVVVCPQGLKCCKSCGIEASGGMHEFKVLPDSPKLIECTDEPSAKVRSILREHLGIPSGCNSHEIEIKGVQNLYDVKLTSMIEMEQNGDKNPYVAIQAWSTHNLDLNTPFTLTARALPDPKTQAGTLLITAVEHTKTSIDDFSLTDEKREALRRFQP